MAFHVATKLPGWMGSGKYRRGPVLVASTVRTLPRWSSPRRGPGPMRRGDGKRGVTWATTAWDACFRGTGPISSTRAIRMPKRVKSIPSRMRYPVPGRLLRASSTTSAPSSKEACFTKRSPDSEEDGKSAVMGGVSVAAGRDSLAADTVQGLGGRIALALARGRSAACLTRPCCSSVGA